MTRQSRLRFGLVLVGISFLAGLYPLISLWPSRFRWRPEQPEYEQMIIVIYAVLGIFLIRAALDPLRHLSLIWFTVWSSLAHAVLMAVNAIRNLDQRIHLVGDVPALVIVAVTLSVLTRAARHGPS